DAGCVIPRSDDPAFIPALLDLCRDEGVVLVVPTRDEELGVLAEARHQFEAAGVTVLVSSPEAIERCLDKRRFGEVVAAAGLETPAELRRGDVIGPAFVKPRRGKGGRGAQRVHDPAELEAALAAGGPDAIVQELVTDPEFTIDVFVDFEGRPISCVPRERVLVAYGESVVSRTVDDPELVASTLRLVAALGVVGHLTVQAFRGADRIRFIEVNPRYGGAANLGFAAGAPTPRYALALALGESLQPRLGDYERDLTMLRYGDDLFVRGAFPPTSPKSLSGSPPQSSLSIGARRVRLGSREVEVEAVVFDLDDTLYPEHAFVDAGFRAVARFLASPIGWPEHRIVERLWSLHDAEGRGHLFDTLMEEAGTAADPDLVQACVLVYRGARGHLEPFPGVTALLGELHAAGIRIGLLTDGAPAVQLRKVRDLGWLETMFDAVILTDELAPAARKPLPTAFRVAGRLLGVQPERAVYVGNDPGKDFAGARTAGLATIRVGQPPAFGGLDTTGSTVDDADVVVTSIDGLREILAGVAQPDIA
ncbi:MAG TPA: HAD family hydrolase, partial [Candidatus Limnocylindrales bacterium]|nr:HAD family hydrolase [Candidatus Limnocylindrales bacterium]